MRQGATKTPCNTDRQMHNLRIITHPPLFSWSYSTAHCSGLPAPRYFAPVHITTLCTASFLETHRWQCWLTDTVCAINGGAHIPNIFVTGDRPGACGEYFRKLVMRGFHYVIHRNKRRNACPYDSEPELGPSSPSSPFPGWN